MATVERTCMVCLPFVFMIRATGHTVVEAAWYEAAATSPLLLPNVLSDSVKLHFMLGFGSWLT